MALQNCPYLGLEDIPARPVPPPSSQHRCLVRVPSERVGILHQTNICLTTGFRQCPRLAARRAVAPQPVPQSPQAKPEESQIKPEETCSEQERTEQERTEQERTERERTEHQPAVGPSPKARRRPISVEELFVFGLGISIVFAALFIVFAIVHRVQVGPGMEVASDGADRSATLTAQALPTLVPTFTPTPLPSGTPAAPATVLAQGPTPIPEPTVRLPTPIVRIPAGSPPTRLVIPAISVDIPILTVGTKTIREGTKLKVVWDDLPNGGGFHQTSANPGNPGNTVINGHRDTRGSVFRHLNDVQPGDEILLYVGDALYPYVAVETVVVPETFASAAQRAENLKYIGYMPEERLTLVTCTPVGLATHRLLVIAKPPEQVTPQMPEAGSDADR